MAGQPDEYPPYDEDCDPRYDEFGDPMPNVSIPIVYTPCEAENGIKICWNRGPECEDTDIGPQGYYIYKTTTPPVTGHESLCLSFMGEPKLYDRSSWKHNVRLLSGELAQDKVPVFTNKTPFGFLPEQQSLNLYRTPGPPTPPGGGPDRSKEYALVSTSTRFDFRDDDFTIEFWAGNHRVPWVYYFPVQTLLAAYDASNNKRCWRIYIEPYSVTQSQAGCRCGSCTYGTPPGCSTQNQSTGTLIVEFFENGDGSGSVVRQQVMTLGTGPTWQTSPTGTTSNYGYFHIAVLRRGGVLETYVDGVLRASTPMPWYVAFNSQDITVGRHFGNSGRLNAGQFQPRAPDWTPVPAVDGDHSYFHGAIYDLRITKNEAAVPPVGGRPGDICKRPVWFDLFTRVGAVPGGVSCWTDKDVEIGKDTYYRITSVACDSGTLGKCPSYITARVSRGAAFSNLWVDNAADLQAYLNREPPTLLDIFNDWDRSDPKIRGAYYPKGVGATGDHAAWFFDNSRKSFVQPNNASRPVHIVSPETYYQTSYTHEAVVKSDNRDDDTVGIVGAYAIDDDGDHWSLIFARTQGGQQPGSGWGAYVLGPGVHTVYLPGYNSCGFNTGLPWVRRNSGGTSCAGSGGTSGWSGLTSSVMVKRERNIIRGYASNYMGSGNTKRANHRPDASYPVVGGDYSNFNSMIEIDFDSTPPPSPLADWSMFKDRPTGVGFMTWSQASSFYQDWFYYPLIKQRIFDFTNGEPGEVWEYDQAIGGWYKTTDTAWDVVGNEATIITDPDTGAQASFDCKGSIAT